ncbi:MAG: putative lipoprotein YiaD [Pseudomonas sp.]|nr:MAG: putative lipoprotein YiaD [Pseudomonas sp.]
MKRLAYFRACCGSGGSFDTSRNPKVNTSLTRKVSLLAGAIALSGCATLNDAGKNYGTAIGCAGGALLGAGLTYAITGDAKKAALGGGVGAAVGCVAGNLWQNRLQDLERVAREENLNIQLQTLQTQQPAASNAPAVAPADAGIVAQVQDEGMFASGSAQLSADGQRQVRKLAAAFAPKPGENAQAAILVVGHTDATGSASTNQRLSEQRARAVASILAEQGISAQRMFFQGAGASRPIADNSDSLQRGKNRRVEIVEVTDRNMLVKRINAEQNNTRYLAHGTSTQPTRTVASVQSKPAVKEKAVRNDKTNDAGPALVDFGGQPASDSRWSMGQSIAPKKAGFVLVSSAHANDLPTGSCEADRPRETGPVFNLASGQVLDTRTTTDYLPGYNNRVWANLVNGHLVTLSPVSILRDGANVDRQPFIEVVKGYDQGNRKSIKSNAVANTYEGEDLVLYRVFTQDSKAPVSCIDVVFSKKNAEATDGALFYPHSREAYTARFVPIRS